MSEVYPIQQSFLGGVLSPKLSGLSENPKYAVGLKECNNWQITPQGSIRLRQGSRYLADAQSAASVIFNYSRANRTDTMVEVNADKVIVYDENGDKVIQDNANADFIQDKGFLQEWAIWKFSRTFTVLNSFINDKQPTPSPPQIQAGIGVTLRTGTYRVFDPVAGFVPYLEENPQEVSQLITVADPAQELRFIGKFRQDTTEQFLPATFEFIINIRFTNSDTGALIASDQLKFTPSNSQTGNVLTSNFTFTPNRKNMNMTIEVTYTGESATIGLYNTLFHEFSLKSTASVNQEAEFPSPYQDVNLRDIQVALDTGNKVMVFTHPEVAPHELVESFNGIFTFEPITFVGAPTAWQAGDYPKVCKFYQGRLWLASTPMFPSTIWASKTTDPNSQPPTTFRDFTLGNNAGDGMEFTLQTNGVIHWLRGNKVLLIGTDKSEWIGTSEEAIMTPKDFRFEEQSRLGSKDNVAPQYVADQIGWVGLDSRKVRATNYDGDLTNTWESHDLSLQADNLMFTRVVDMAYARDPDYQLAVVLGDGTLAVCMTDRILDLNAWYTYSTDGFYRSVEFSNDPTGSSLWVVVERDDGAYIERFSAGDEIKSHLDSYVQRPIENFGDDNGVGGFSNGFSSGFDGNGIAAQGIQGLDRYEGMTVDVVVQVDGVLNNQPDNYYTYTGKEYVYLGKTKIATIEGMSTAFVGYTFRARAETWPSEWGNNAGTGQGTKRHFNRIFSRCINDSAYPILNDYRPIPENPRANPLDSTVTDDVEIRNEGTLEKGVIVIEQDLPLATEIASVFGKQSSGVT